MKTTVRPQVRLTTAIALVAVAIMTACSSPSTPAGTPGDAPSASVKTTSTPPPLPTVPGLAPPNLPQGDKMDFVDITTDQGVKVKRTILEGKQSGVKLKVFVWTPPQYDDPAYKDTKFPVLFLYPGGPGATYNTWLNDHTYGAMSLVKKESAAGKVHPFIFVMPFMQLKDSLETECTDIPGQPKVGTFMDTDLPAMVLANFRALPPGKAWGASGGSSGAWCATTLAFRHPEIFNTVVSIGGYFEIQTGLKGAESPEILAMNPQVMAAKNPPPINLMVHYGTADMWDTKRAKKFLAVVKPPLQVKPFPQEGGKHLTEHFKKIMPDVFEYFTTHMTAAQPLPAGAPSPTLHESAAAPAQPEGASTASPTGTSQ